MISRDEVVEKLKAQLDQMNAEMAKLEARYKDMQAEMRGQMEAGMAQMREHAARARHQLETLREAAEANWKSLVSEGERVQNAFLEAYKTFMEQMSSGSK